MIQLAGAFVLLQKGRLRPADALLQLAESSLRDYPRLHGSIDLAAVRALIASWRGALARAAFTENPLNSLPPPALALPGE